MDVIIPINKKILSFNFALETKNSFETIEVPLSFNLLWEIHGWCVLLSGSDKKMPRHTGIFPVRKRKAKKTKEERKEIRAKKDVSF